MVTVYRDGRVSYNAQFWDFFLGDTYTKDRLTVRAGLRYDHQIANQRPTFADANPVFPELLPALDYDGSGQGVRWNNLSPRIGATYALDEKRKTVTHVSYARYAGRIAAFDAAYDSPIGLYGTFIAYNWADRNGDGFAQKDEVLLDEGVQYAGGVDPDNPTSPTTSNRIDPNYQARHDDEVIVGIERELRPSLALSLAYTFRRGNDRAGTPRIGLTSADYTPNPPESANGYTAQTFSPDPDTVDASNNGYIRTNRPDYRRTFSGFEPSLVKRLSHRWMARASVASNDWHENFLGPRAIQSPTRFRFEPLLDGGQVPDFSARWQVNANALYELPHGFEVSGVLFGSQGHLNPVFLILDAGVDGRPRALATPNIEDHRLPSIWNLDLRLAKTVKLHGATSLVLSADLFNVFNGATTAARTSDAGSDAFDRINGIMGPRILRFGLRLTF